MKVVIASAAVTTDYPVWLVCLLGMGIVFLGLICLIMLCYIMSGIVRGNNNKGEAAPTSAPIVPVTANTMSAEEKGRVVAAVSVAIAEELGTDVEAIRILSIKRV